MENEDDSDLDSIIEEQEPTRHNVESPYQLLRKNNIKEREELYKKLEIEKSKKHCSEDTY